MNITFNTLNTLIDDIILEARNNNISESEQLSRNQIEQWIIQYRSFLIRQEVDRGNGIDPSWVQTIYGIPLVDVDQSFGFMDISRWVSVTSSTFPPTVNLKGQESILSITDETGKLIQLSTEKRSSFQGYRKYTNKDYIAYEKDNKIYVSGPNELKKINVSALFENPSEAENFETGDEAYPIPAHMLPTIKELIMSKELDIVSVTDKTNNSSDDISKTQLNQNDYKQIQRGAKQ